MSDSDEELGFSLRSLREITRRNKPRDTTIRDGPTVAVHRQVVLAGVNDATSTNETTSWPENHRRSDVENLEENQMGAEISPPENHPVVVQDFDDSEVEDIEGSDGSLSESEARELWKQLSERIHENMAGKNQLEINAELNDTWSADST